VGLIYTRIRCLHDSLDDSWVSLVFVDCPRRRSLTCGGSSRAQVRQRARVSPPLRRFVLTISMPVFVMIRSCRAHNARMLWRAGLVTHLVRVCMSLCGGGYGMRRAFAEEWGSGHVLCIHWEHSSWSGWSGATGAELGCTRFLRSRRTRCASVMEAIGLTRSRYLLPVRFNAKGVWHGSLALFEKLGAPIHPADRHDNETIGVGTMTQGQRYSQRRSRFWCRSEKRNLGRSIRRRVHAINGRSTFA
jgi:hypothetical protein